jgi:hypothetical protein
LGPLAHVCLAVLGILVAAARPAAEATHQPDHRFIVLGFVTDAQGRPVPEAAVVVTRVRTGLEYATRTEPDGFYLVVVHLHDEDEGERLHVRGTGASGEIRARYDVAQRKVERGTRVDLRAGGLVELRAAFAETLRAYLNR